MAFDKVRDSLPWLVPSVAIVFAASGFLDLGGDDPLPEAAPPTFSAAPVPAPVPAPAPITEVEEVVARQAPPEESFAPLAPAQPSTAPQIAADPTQCLDELQALADQTRVYFPSGGLQADPVDIEKGRILALTAQDCPGVQIRAEGHSDPSGNPDVNLRLSQARAEEVIRRIGTSGLDTSMFFAKGMGDSAPSTVTGSQPRSFYDRRVEFTIVSNRVAQPLPRSSLAPSPWAQTACVNALEQAVLNATVYYEPRTVSASTTGLDAAMTLAQMATDCPHARLRVIGHHADGNQPGEDVGTGLLRAKALMAMLVGQGIAPEKLIIAAPSRPVADASAPGSRVRFEVIVDDS